MPNESSAGVVLFGEEKGRRKYLILHYEEGHWDFPKGHLESGESAKDAAIRECREETGLTKLDFASGFEEKIDYWYTRDKQKRHKDVTFFLARSSESEVRISDEHVGFVWLAYEDALKRVTFPNARQLLEKAESFMKKQKPS